MQNTTRTTVRIRTELLDKSRLIALKQNTSIQDVINEALTVGFKHITNIKGTENSFRTIDKFRKNTANKKIDLKKLRTASMNELK